MDKGIILPILDDVLGDRRKSNDRRLQYAWDCPVCSAEKGEYDGDGKGNFEVNLKKGVFKCWVCCDTHRTKGSIQTLFRKFGTPKHISLLEKVGFRYKPMKDDYDVEDEEETKKSIELPDGYTKFSDLSSVRRNLTPSYNYLKKRGVTDDIIEKYQLGFTEVGTHSHRIIIPSFNKDGDVNYYATRTYVGAKPKYLNDESPKETVIFNEHLINWDSTIYLVEGPFDHIVVPNSIPLLGKDFSELLFDTIMKKANGYVVILLDPDAWERATQVYAQLDMGRLKDKIRIIKLPEDIDISKIHEQYGKEGVIHVLKSSQKLKESSIHT
jgi:DNA primase